MKRSISASHIGWRPHAVNPTMAGVRYRCLNPLRVLRQQGVPVELYNPAEPDRYAAVIVQGLSCLEQASSNYATGDAFLREVEVLKSKDVKIVVDDCDNHFYNPHDRPEWHAASSRLRTLIAMADHLVASTEAVANLYREEAAATQPITVIGDGVESERSLRADSWLRDIVSWRRQRTRLSAYAFSRRMALARANGELVCVWFGSHGSRYADGGMLDLLKIKDVLEDLASNVSISLTVISNSRQKFDSSVAQWRIPTRYIEWDRISFPIIMQAHDVALIPVTPTPFTLCKTNNRLVTALHYGIAVAADSIPSYEPFRATCALDNWHDGLLAYAKNPALRQAHIDQGQQLIAEKWTEEHLAMQWGALFHRYLPSATCMTPHLTKTA